MSLIHPSNVKKIIVVKETSVPQIHAATRSITFLSYSAILKRIGLTDSKSRIVIVDTQQYSIDLLIDKKLIKKIVLKGAVNDTILIKTKFYEQRIKEAKHPSIRIRGGQPSLTTR